MENTRNQHATYIPPVEHDMLAMLHAAQAGADIITSSAQIRIASELLATYFQIVNIADSLVFTPSIQSVTGDIYQVGFCSAGKTKRGHTLALLSAELEPLPNARKGTFLGNAAGIPLIYRGP
jgi:hypothetical protein